MAFNRPTLNNLILRVENDIISRLTGLVPLLSRALLKILARVFAGAFDSVYGNQQFISLQITVGTASLEWLERYAFQWDVEIKDPTFSDGMYLFTGVDTTNVPVNTVIVRDDNVEYITTTSGDIGDTDIGQLLLEIQCREAGTIGNVEDTTPMQLASPIIGVDTLGAVSGGDISNGEDGDTIEEIRQNILNRMQLPPMGGSPNDYEVISEGVAGVDKAFTFPNQAGSSPIPGSVTVVIKGNDPIAPSAGILSDVLDAINDPSFKPTTASHFTAAIDAKLFIITVAITPRNQTIEDNISQNLNDTLEADSVPGGLLLISHIRNAISTSGVSDYEINFLFVETLGILPVDENIQFTGFQYPYIENVQFQDL